MIPSRRSRERHGPDDRGASVVEYGLLLAGVGSALVAVVAVLSVTTASALRAGAASISAPAATASVAALAAPTVAAPTSAAPVPTTAAPTTSTPTAATPTAAAPSSAPPAVQPAGTVALAAGGSQTVDIGAVGSSTHLVATVSPTGAGAVTWGPANRLVLTASASAPLLTLVTVTWSYADNKGVAAGAGQTLFWIS